MKDVEFAMDNIPSAGYVLGEFQWEIRRLIEKECVSESEKKSAVDFLRKSIHWQSELPSCMHAAYRDARTEIKAAARKIVVSWVWGDLSLAFRNFDREVRARIFDYAWKLSDTDNNGQIAESVLQLCCLRSAYYNVCNEIAHE